MGYLYLAIKIPQLIAITVITNVASYIISLILSALARIGLFKSPDPDDHISGGSVSYVLILDGASPSLQPVPIHVVTAAIKDKVNIVRYEDYVCPYVGNEVFCTVCLDCVRTDDLVRELVNCKHVFHQECLDRWVDEGQVNCPLCRSILLPSKSLLSSDVSSPIAVTNDDPVE